MIRKILIILALLAIIAPSGVLPAPQTLIAQAATQVSSPAATFGGCVAGTSVAPALENVIQGGISQLQNKIKSIGVLSGLFSSFLAGKNPLSTTVPVTDQGAGNVQTLVGAFTNLNYRDNIIGRCLARQILNGLIENTHTVIQTRGRDGGVTFVQNWANFQTQAQARGTNVFRAMLSTAGLCSYFGNDLKASYGLKPTDRISLPGQNTQTNSVVPFSTQIGCTLPANFTLQNYAQDFAGNGGWDAFARLMQPQNNPFGAALLSDQQVAQQRSLAESADVNQVLANKGYTGISGNGKSDSCSVMFAGQCVVYKNIVTTGTYLADSEAATVGAQFSWLTNTQQLGGVIEDMTTVVLNHLLDQANPDDGSYGSFGPNGEFGLTSGFAASPTPTPGPTCAPTAPQAGFLNALTTLQQQFSEFNFTSSAATVGDTGLPQTPGISGDADIDQLNIQLTDTVGSTFASQIGDIKSNIDQFSSVACLLTNDPSLLTSSNGTIPSLGIPGSECVTGLGPTTLDPSQSLVTQQRATLAEAQTEVLTLINALISSVNQECPSTATPTPSPTATP